MFRDSTRWFELGLWVVGFLALGDCTILWMNARLHQVAGNQELDRRLKSNTTTTRPDYGGLIGRLEIPRLQLSVIVFEGTDSEILDLGVGHLPGSALPGETGNVVLAGHRDTFFRCLRHIREGDVVNITTEGGRRSYAVESAAAIDPNQTGVLAATPASTLTLITCYPFRYVGNAPRRFIVRCRGRAAE